MLCSQLFWGNWGSHQVHFTCTWTPETLKTYKSFDKAPTTNLNFVLWSIIFSSVIWKISWAAAALVHLSWVTAGKPPSPGVRSFPMLCGHKQGLLPPAKGRKNRFLGNMPQGVTVPGISPFLLTYLPCDSQYLFFLNIRGYKLSVAIHHIKWGSGAMLPTERSRDKEN